MAPYKTLIAGVKQYHPDMKRKAAVLVSLTGGLGNQLFLLAAGLKYANGGSIELLSDFGRPRVAKDGSAELHSFAIPKHLILFPRSRPSWLISKAVGFTLRSSIYPKVTETRLRIPEISRWISSLLVSVKLRRCVIISTIKSKKIGRRKKYCSEMLVGYFQDRFSALDADVHRILMGLKPKNPSKEFDSFLESKNNIKKLVVHIRLGDYRTEKSFGILPVSYYHEAIKKSFIFEKFDEIWIFSDEPDVCEEYVPERLRHLLRIVDNFQDDSTLTLELMRHGDGFVIANSTFSWWAATLAYNQESKVIYPNPWFVSRETSEFLIPTKWIPGNR